MQTTRVSQLDQLAAFTSCVHHRSRPGIMGVLNVTPDSFSDGGQYPSVAAAVTAAQIMMEQGADIIDIGGESTRPGAPEVAVAEELQRVVPVVAACVAAGIPVSVDTSKPEVMQSCLELGVVLINDVNGFRAPGVLAVLEQASIKPWLCVMHMQGTPRTMQVNPQYHDLFDDIAQFFKARIHELENIGFKSSHILLDPGFGFGKTDEHNWALLSKLERFAYFEKALLVGLSRKSMFGRLLKRTGSDWSNFKRLPSSLAGALIAAQKGARVLRVHDVLATFDALKVLEAVMS